jgi:hypothetical protein
MRIIPLAIPTPFYVGDVIVYLIKEEPLTLIDCGPKTPEAYKTLREKLKRNGVALDGTGAAGAPGAAALDGAVKRARQEVELHHAPARGQRESPITSAR